MMHWLVRAALVALSVSFHPFQHDSYAPCYSGALEFSTVSSRRRTRNRRLPVPGMQETLRSSACSYRKRSPHSYWPMPLRPFCLHESSSSATEASPWRTSNRTDVGSSQQSQRNNSDEFIVKNMNGKTSSEHDKSDMSTNDYNKDPHEGNGGIDDKCYEYFTDTFDLNQALNNLAELATDPRQPVIRYAAIAEQLWKDYSAMHQEKQHLTSKEACQPDMVSFNTVLKAWARAAHSIALSHYGDNNSGEGVYDAASPRKTREPKTNDPRLVRYYAMNPSVLVVTAKDCAQRAASLLQKMEDDLVVELAKLEAKAVTRDDDDATMVGKDTKTTTTRKFRRSMVLHPDRLSYNTCLDAWAKSRAGFAEVMPKAQLLMNQMKELQDGDPTRHLVPDIYSYNSLIDICAHDHADSPNQEYVAAKSDADDSAAKGSRLSHDPRLMEVLRIRKLIESDDADPSVRPTVRTYNSILHAYSRVASSATQRLQQQQWNKIKRNTAYDDNVEADRLGKAALDLLNEIKAKAAIQEEEFEQAQSMASNSDDHSSSSVLPPSTDNHPQALKPDAITYSTAMDVLSKVGKLWATEASVKLLDELKRHPDKALMSPTPYTYTTLINTWSRTPVAYAADEAQALLNELIDKFWTTKDSNEEPASSPSSDVAKNDCRPTHRPFTAAIHTLARSQQGDKAVKALEILKRMKEVANRVAEADDSGDWTFQLTPAPYYATLDCCMKTTDHRYQDAAMRIAFAVFKDMQGTKGAAAKPNAKTFTKLLRCIADLWPASEERNKVAQAVFEKAVVAGQVNAPVLLALQKSVDGALLQKLLGPDLCNHKGTINFKRIPAAWSNHVRA